MNRKKILPFLGVALAVALSFALQMRSSDWDSDWNRDNSAQPLKLLGTIAIPGKPIASTDIAWVDQTTGRFFFSDRSNASVDVVDARHDLYLAKIATNGTAATVASTTVASSAEGTVHFTGLTSPSTHEGPNGVVSTSDKLVWADDGDSTSKLLDLDPASPNYLQIIAVVNTVPLAGAGPGGTTLPACTGGATGSCNRADEMAYDADDGIIVAANDEPTSVPPYLTFFSTQAPYPILGQMNFLAQGDGVGGSLEQPVWDPQIHRFLQTLPPLNEIAVIKAGGNPFKMTVERTISLPRSCTGEALAPDGHLVLACGTPLVIDVATGEEIGPGITEVGGGDEVNYDPGDNRFVVSSNVDASSSNPQVLGVINAANGQWLQNLPPATPAPSGGTMGTGGLETNGRSGNLAAFGGNNHVFVVVHPAAPPATDICGFFTPPPVAPATVGTPVDFGCVAVFGPTGKPRSDNGGFGR
jgi:hypothetical protein